MMSLNFCPETHSSLDLLNPSLIQFLLLSENRKEEWVDTEREVE